MRKILLLSLILMTRLAFGQCDAKDKVVISGDFGSVEYIMHCPTYNFSFEGSDSPHWNILNDPININQVPKLIEIKERLESRIRDYAGPDFFSHLKFYSAEITWPDSISKFKNRGPKVEMDRCNATYFFYYYFIPTEGVKHCIGVALNDSEEIISEFGFPSKNEYKTLDATLNICEVIKIATETNSQIEPIDKISFDFDKENRQYYWTVSQKIVKPSEGENSYNKVLINASDRTKIIQTKGKAFIQFHNRF